jgi:Putative zinc-finger
LDRSKEESRLKPLNPNSLRKALASQPGAPHPDADLLNGFQEGSLRAGERRRILEHLAGCDQCRAVLALASDVDLPLSVEPAPVRRPIFRIALPAFTTAAAVGVAVFVALHRRVPSAQHPDAVSVQSSAAPASVPAAAAPASAPGANKDHVSAASPERAGVAAALQARASAPPSVAAVPSPVTTAQAELAPAQRSPDVKSKIAADASAGVPPSVRQESPTESNLGLTTPSSAFANTVTTQALAKAAATPMARPHWRINRQGQTERALGSGPWQSVLPSDVPPMRVLATAGADVWTGGDNAQLYHSSDDGQTWLRIVLPEKNGAAHSIAHIRIDSATEITVRASDGTTWMSRNGGASWK